MAHSTGTSYLGNSTCYTYVHPGMIFRHTNTQGIHTVVNIPLTFSFTPPCQYGKADRYSGVVTVSKRQC